MTDPTNGITPEQLKVIAKAAALRKPGQSFGKKIKPRFRHVIECDWFRTFGFKERIKILFGAGLHVQMRTPTLHKPGELGTIVIGTVTDDLTATDYMREQAKYALRKEYGDQLPPDAQANSTL
jgi:hypothetical protein